MPAPPDDEVWEEGAPHWADATDSAEPLFRITRRGLLVAGAAAGAGYLVLRDRGGGGDGHTATPGAPTSTTLGPPPTTPAVIGDPPDLPAGHVFDVVITGGRVIDPMTRYDMKANVGIDGARVTSITTEPLNGRRTIDAAGRVVAPGFIDLLSYEPNMYGDWYKIADGVTTNLGMHGLNWDPVTYFDYFGRDEHRPPFHYGGAFDDPFVRNGRLGLGVSDAAAGATLDQLAQLAAEGIHAGFLGIDVEPEYTPGVTLDEMVRLGEVGAELGVPVTFHARYSDPDHSPAGFREIIEVAKRTGVAVHVDHVTSMGTYVMETTLGILEDARREGLDVTGDMYPYDFWATTLGSARFAPGWQERFRITYDDLVVAGTGERLTESSFAQHQRTNTLVAAYAIPEADVVTALATSFVMIGSDAILNPDHNNHPRATGCFARTLGRYVRERKTLDLVDALAKMTSLPARRLEKVAPALRRKGRLQVGADADVVVFDPDTVGDRSTVENPAQESVGIEWVLVDGTVVRSPSGTDRNVRPGRAIRSEL